MAIRMRRGLLGELDESKLLAGEWAVTIDAETNRQQVLMCFGAGIVKRMGTYNDFSDMIAEISGDLLNSYKVELEMIKSAVETMASEVNSDKEEVVIIHDGIVNTLMPQIEQYAISTQTSAENASISEQNASRYATNSLDSAELSAEFSDLAKSYAKGGTGLREGEETDNAKYYMEQAKAAAGGDYIATSEKGQAGGVATLNADGKVPAEQLPEMGGNVVVDGTSITQDEETKAISVAKEIIDDIADLKDNKADAKDLTDHTDSLVMSADGVHGLRYYEEKLEALDEAGNWNEIETGGVTASKIVVTTPSDEFVGENVVLSTSDGTVLKTIAFDDSKTVIFDNVSPNTYTVTCGESTKEVKALIVGDIYHVELIYIINGNTVLPIDDVSIWLKCAGITDKTYTNISEVLADTDTLYLLMSNEESMEYLARSTGFISEIVENVNAMTLIGQSAFCDSVLLKKDDWIIGITHSDNILKVFSDLVPAITAANSYITFSTQWDTSQWAAFRVFDKTSFAWVGKNNDNSDWVQLVFEDNKKIYAIAFIEPGGYRSTGCEYFLSEDGNEFESLGVYNFSDLHSSISFGQASEMTPAYFLPIKARKNYKGVKISPKGNYGEMRNGHGSCMELYILGRP